MKVTNSIIFGAILSLSALSQALAGSLRSSGPNDDNMVHGFGGATFFINHVSYSGTWDEDIVGKAFKDAFNSVYRDEDIVIIDSFMDRMIELPESSGNHLQEGGPTLVQSAVVGSSSSSTGSYDSISDWTYHYGKSDVASIPVGLKHVRI
jgi:hypothetical protein